MAEGRGGGGGGGGGTAMCEEREETLCMNGDYQFSKSEGGV